MLRRARGFTVSRSTSSILRIINVMSTSSTTSSRALPDTSFERSVLPRAPCSLGGDELPGASTSEVEDEERRLLLNRAYLHLHTDANVARMQHNSLLFSRKLKTAIAETAKKSEPSCTTSTNLNAAATGTTTRSGVRGTTKASASVGGMFEDATSSKNTSLKDQVRAMNSRLENEKREQWSLSKNTSDTSTHQFPCSTTGSASPNRTATRTMSNPYQDLLHYPGAAPPKMASASAAAFTTEDASSLRNAESATAGEDTQLKQKEVRKMKTKSDEDGLKLNDEVARGAEAEKSQPANDVAQPAPPPPVRDKNSAIKIPRSSEEGLFGSQRGRLNDAKTDADHAAETSARNKGASARDRVAERRSRMQAVRDRVRSAAKNLNLHHPTGAPSGIGIAAERQAIGRLLQSMKEKPLPERQSFFRQQLRKYHPDKGVGTEEDAKRINEAAFHFLMEQQGWFLL